MNLDFGEGYKVHVYGIHGVEAVIKLLMVMVRVRVVRMRVSEDDGLDAPQFEPSVSLCGMGLDWLG